MAAAGFYIKGASHRPVTYATPLSWQDALFCSETALLSFVFRQFAPNSFAELTQDR